jgi:hypothetical protein
VFAAVLPAQKANALKVTDRRDGGTFETGATGLEPATSGVTGRYGATGYDRIRPGITGWSRHFAADRTGYDRLRPAATRHSLCGICVVEMVPATTTLHQTTWISRLADESSRVSAQSSSRWSWRERKSSLLTVRPAHAIRSCTTTPPTSSRCSAGGGEIACCRRRRQHHASIWCHSSRSDKRAS